MLVRCVRDSNHRCVDYIQIRTQNGQLSLEAVSTLCVVSAGTPGLAAHVAINQLKWVETVICPIMNQHAGSFYACGRRRETNYLVCVALVGWSQWQMLATISSCSIQSLTVSPSWSSISPEKFRNGGSCCATSAAETALADVST